MVDRIEHIWPQRAPGDLAAGLDLDPARQLDARLSVSVGQLAEIGLGGAKPLGQVAPRVRGLMRVSVVDQVHAQESSKKLSIEQ